MIDPFMALAGRLQGEIVIPLLYRFGWMQWEDIAFGWSLFAVYGFFQVLATWAVCMPLEAWRPVERWTNRRVVLTDMAYTLIARVGLLPLVTFVAFYQVQVWVNGWIVDHGWIPPDLELLIPPLLGHPVITFFVYAVILDFADYWRHRLSHIVPSWYALHSLHHAQRQMTFWSDDRNHLLDDFISALWFGFIALLIGISPFQFPLLVLLLRFVESLSHANARVSFGWLGDRLLVSPRFHRAHHGVLAAGRQSCNYGAVLPWWDMIFGTADFSRDFVPTGDPGAPEALASGGYLAQQSAGLRALAVRFRRARPAPAGSSRAGIPG
jgi:sterol desaturase/sphingolipid hydroxylase (fatty acid hydroxylase superfamily)